MNALKIILLSGVFLFLSSCATSNKRALSSVREPASISSSCFSIIKNIFSKTRPEEELGSRFKIVQALIEKGEGREELSLFIDDLQERVMKIDNEELTNKWMKLERLKSRFIETGEFQSVASRWSDARDEFIVLFGEVRRGKSERVIEQRVEELSEFANLGEKSLNDLKEVEKRDLFFKFLGAKEYSTDLGLGSSEELRYFSFWMLKEGDWAKKETVQKFYQDELFRFRKAFSKLGKGHKRELENEGQKAILSEYNRIAGKSITPESFTEDTLELLVLYKGLDRNFDFDGFYKWLIENDELGESRVKSLSQLRRKEGLEEINVGLALRDSYQRYAPFQEIPIIEDKSIVDKTMEKAKFFWQKFKREAPECTTLECFNKKGRSGWGKLFSSRYYQEKFSCMAHNPVALKSMVMDLGLIWGAIYWSYRGKEEEFQRFPWEIIVNGAVFAPILAEANCRASFKGHLPFGSMIPESALSAKPVGRFFKNWRGVAFKGFLSSVGLLTMTMGFDHIFLAMGESIAKPLGLNDMLVLLPVTYLYYGAWMGMKHMAFINPMRHKVLPRLSKAIAKKVGIKKAYWPLQTGLDFGLFQALVLYGQWEYLTVYHAELLPFVTGTFTAGVALEHKQEISKEGVTTHTYTTENENGIRTETEIIEENGKVKVESVDVDASDTSLDAWADQILKGLPE